MAHAQGTGGTHNHTITRRRLLQGIRLHLHGPTAHLEQRKPPLKISATPGGKQLSRLGFGDAHWHPPSSSSSPLCRESRAGSGGS